MKTSCFELEVKDQVAHLVLSRAEQLNTMIPAFWSELPQLVNQLSDAGEARALVISSTGRHFSAGMDLAVFQGGSSAFSADTRPGSDASAPELGRVRAGLRTQALALQDSFSCFERARMPVIAAIQGGCIGGGVDMICAADLRYCSADAFFCIQEINIGMTADVGTLQRLPRLIPDGVARELAYTGRRLPAAEAQALGLVNRVFADPAALVAGALEVAREIAGKSPLAIWGSKEMLNYTRDHSVADGLNYIATWQTGMFQPGDMLECFRAKAEQRAPRFQDLLPLKRGF